VRQIKIGLPKISRRRMLQTIGAGTAGTAMAALSGASALAAFSTPTPGLRYQKYGGHDFKPITGTTTSWVYNDNGSIYADFSVPGGHAFSTRLQLPQGAFISEVQFNFFSNDSIPLDFSLIAFDLQNGFDVLFTSTSSTPNADIQTISLAGSPAVVDNAVWNYVLRWRPGVSGPAHILWGARVGFRGGIGDS
jgi:hypothetical protein